MYRWTVRLLTRSRATFVDKVDERRQPLRRSRAQTPDGRGGTRGGSCIALSSVVAAAATLDTKPSPLKESFMMKGLLVSILVTLAMTTGCNVAPQDGTDVSSSAEQLVVDIGNTRNISQTCGTPVGPNMVCKPGAQITINATQYTRINIQNTGTNGSDNDCHVSYRWGHCNGDENGWTHDAAPGAVVRLADTGTLPLGSQTLCIRAENDGCPSLSDWSATLAITH
jgi:hypothetical protein